MVGAAPHEEGRLRHLWIAGTVNVLLEFRVIRKNRALWPVQVAMERTFFAAVAYREV